MDWQFVCYLANKVSVCEVSEIIMINKCSRVALLYFIVDFVFIFQFSKYGRSMNFLCEGFVNHK